MFLKLFSNQGHVLNTKNDQYQNPKYKIVQNGHSFVLKNKLLNKEHFSLNKPADSSARPS